ncbi:MAG: DUF4347 domain-containing protein, partial [Minisyncoccia bacterium]
MSGNNLVPYIPPTPVEYSKYTNIVFISPDIEATQFSSYCNDSTYPLVYNNIMSRESIQQFIFNFNNLKRIAFAFHGIKSIGYQYTPFINNDVFFDIDESLTIMNTENYLFMKGLIQQLSLTNIDFLACNLLYNNAWRVYFETLQSIGNTIIGASDDDTGSIKYGGDWVMENTMEDIKTVYFKETVDDYQYSLQMYWGGRGFIGIKSNNNIFSWGQKGMTPSSLQTNTKEVLFVYHNTWSNAVLFTDRSMVVWGGGNIYGGEPGYNGYTDPASLVNITKVTPGAAWAVLKSDGSVKCWGDGTKGGDVSPVQSQLNNVVDIYSSMYGFAALKEDGTVVYWGYPSGGVNISSEQLSNMTNVVSMVTSENVFVA